MIRADARYAADLLADLVRTPSVNPEFDPGSEGERPLAEQVGAELASLGMDVSLHDAAPGRTSVVGRLPGAGGGPSLLLYAHLDTVGTDGMADPFSAEVRNGRLHGRGAYDMKGGLAACLAAVRALRDAGARLRGDLLVVGVADEEVASLGMQEVLRHHAADAAIVTEPTELALCLAHKGFCWIEVEVRGHAAHGSRFDLGVDANLRMGRLLAALEPLERALRDAPPHPLVGPPSLHVGLLEGGSGPSIYAARARAILERRTLPGETGDGAVAEVRAVAERLAAEDPSFHATVRPLLARDPFETSADSPVAHAVDAAAASVLGRAPRRVGVAYWMDAALLAAAGIETVVIGPVGAGAHADVEWVELDSVTRLADILARAAADFCGAAEAPIPTR